MKKLEKRHIDNKTILYESSLSRIQQHTAENGFFLLSAFRGDNSERENLELNKKLKKDLRQFQFGFIELIGTWTEKKDTPEEKKVSELSLFVPYNPQTGFTSNEFYEFAIDLMYKYKQEAIIFKDIFPDSMIFVLDDDKNEVYGAGTFHPDRIAKEYSTLKYGSHAGRTFIFEGVVKPSNSIHSMLMTKQGSIL